MNMVTKPPLITSEFCRYLSLSKQEFLSEAGQEGLMMQCGATYIDVEIPLPDFPNELKSENAMIETFQVSNDGSCLPLGTNRELIDAFAPCAKLMATAVLKSLRSFGVEIDGAAYLTASITMCNEINGNAHFDDEQYHASDGVGFVAIIGDRGGSRVARESIPHASINDDGVPVIFDQQSADDFDSGLMLIHEGEPQELLIFPQFGQLHAGPALVSAGLTGFRRLMVMRAKTKTKNTVVSSSVKRKRRRRHA
ncbi:MAG: hypothetical protein V7749_04080 [Cocleimonas sp.]